MILVIDNYDSFTFNLVHYLGELGAECDVRRNDALSADEALALRPEAIVLSPGPCTPDEAGICCDLIAAVATQPRPVPLLGVCLGHQAIGQVFGGAVVRTTPMHGKTSPVRHDGTGVFAGLPSPYLATRYHSLIVRRDDLPETLVANAELADGQGAGEAVGEVAADQQTATRIESIDVNEIMAAIPHRFPMLMIDRMVDIELGQQATGIKNVTVNEPFFQGHFPQRPVMPGVLIIEAMAQTAATLVVLTLGEAARGKLVYFMTIEDAKFRRPVGPGDQLRIHVDKQRQRNTVWKFRGIARVDGVSVAEATFSAMIMS